MLRRFSLPERVSVASQNECQVDKPESTDGCPPTNNWYAIGTHQPMPFDDMVRPTREEVSVEMILPSAAEVHHCICDLCVCLLSVFLRSTEPAKHRWRTISNSANFTKLQMSRSYDVFLRKQGPASLQCHCCTDVDSNNSRNYAGRTVAHSSMSAYIQVASLGTIVEVKPAPAVRYSSTPGGS
jgi:hypothetical protein